MYILLLIYFRSINKFSFLCYCTHHNNALYPKLYFSNILTRLICDTIILLITSNNDDLTSLNIDQLTVLSLHHFEA